MPNQPIVTAGLVLRETVTRETDKILTVLTPDRGKISLIARGARRKNSRLAAACQLLAYSELTIYEKGQWFMLDEAETLELFTGLRTDFVALSLASYLADLTDATAQAEDTSQLLRLLLRRASRWPAAAVAAATPSPRARAAARLLLLPRAVR